MSPGCTASLWSGLSRNEREQPCQTGKPTTSPSMTLVWSPSRSSTSKNPRCIRSCCTMMTSPRWNLWWIFCGKCFINQSLMPSTSCWRSTSRVWVWQGCTRTKLPKRKSVQSPNVPGPMSSHCCVRWKKHSHQNTGSGHRLMLTRELEHTLHRTFDEALQRRHEYVTLEHLLYALLDEKTGSEVLQHCGGTLTVLRHELEQFLTQSIETLPKSRRAK